MRFKGTTENQLVLVSTERLHSFSTPNFLLVIIGTLSDQSLVTDDKHKACIQGVYIMSLIVLGRASK